MSKSTERMAFWRDHWEAWAASGVSQRAYCARHGLSLAAFGYWRNRIREAPATPAPTFVPVVIEPPAVPAPVPPSSVTAGVEIRLRGGRVIAIGPEFDGAVLARVIRVLEQVPC